MVPAAGPTKQRSGSSEEIQAGDMNDGGNSYFKDDVRRAKQLKDKGVRYCDVGRAVGSGAWTWLLDDARRPERSGAAA